MKLSIIILNYNTRDLLLGAIRSIHSQVKHEIIVVDNASTDDSVATVAKEFPSVKIIGLTKNLGFAAGNNQGIKASAGEHLLLLNSDTKVTARAIDKLVSYLDLHPSVGIVSPKLVLSDGAIDLSCHRGFPTLGNSLAYFLKLEQLLPNSKFFSGYHQTWKDFNKTHPVAAVSGAAMMFRKSIVDQIGLLDEQFFMYAEDIDFCKRAHDVGWKIIYYPKATVIHLKGSSGTYSRSLDIRSTTRYHFYHTMKQYFAKHHHHPKPVQLMVNKSIDLIAKIRK